MRGVGNKTKYCPECRHERENARARELARIKRERAKHPASGDVRAAASDAAIHKVVCAASAAGVDYGVMAARMEGRL